MFSSKYLNETFYNQILNKLLVYICINLDKRGSKLLPTNFDFDSKTKIIWSVRYKEILKKCHLSCHFIFLSGTLNANFQLTIDLETKRKFNIWISIVLFSKHREKKTHIILISKSYFCFVWCSWWRIWKEEKCLNIDCHLFSILRALLCDMIRSQHFLLGKVN